MQREGEQYVVLLLSFAVWDFCIFSLLFLKVILYEKKVNFQNIFFLLILTFEDYSHQIKMYVEEIEIYQN